MLLPRFFVLGTIDSLNVDTYLQCGTFSVTIRFVS